MVKRQVYIQPVARPDGTIKVYMVLYVERKKGHRYGAAQFERLDTMHGWLLRQPHLELSKRGELIKRKPSQLNSLNLPYC